jgi:hypothetical protein
MQGQRLRLKRERFVVLECGLAIEPEAGNTHHGKLYRQHAAATIRRSNPDVTFCHLSAGHYPSMDSLRTDNLDVRHPIIAEVILNVFDKRLLVPSQPLGIVA